MRLIVIGAVAAGTSAAAKARRNDDRAEIVIYDKDQDISYSGCGMPYYLGDEIDQISALTPRDAAFFKSKYDIDVFTKHEITHIDPLQKKLTLMDLETGKVFEDTYDKLILATGATSFMPSISGIDLPHVFSLRNIRDAVKIKSFLETQKPKKALIVGTGFIGFELLENLQHLGLDVTIVEMMPKITPTLDEDMASYLENALRAKGVKILKSEKVLAIEENAVLLEKAGRVEAELVIMATGVKPNVTLAKQMGIELGSTGAIKVDAAMFTNLKDVSACGDCIETFSVITGKPVYRPLGSTANKTGRIAGDAITGGRLRYQGNLGTGIFKIFNLTVATTGLSEKAAYDEGYDVIVNHNIKPDKPEYFKGEEMVIKGIADRETGRLLGVQIVGGNGVDKRIDVFASLITYGAKVEDLFHLDLAYAPPFSTTKDPIHYTGMILDNAISGGRDIITADEVRKSDEDIQIIDARALSDYENKGHVEGAVNIPHGKVREMLSTLDKDKKTVTYCNKGTTGNAVQNILINHGFKQVKNLSGGHTFYKGTTK